jgi:hypothetical protein
MVFLFPNESPQCKNQPENFLQGTDLDCSIPDTVCSFYRVILEAIFCCRAVALTENYGFNMHSSLWAL